jgi:hypothetical protein
MQPLGGGRGVINLTLISRGSLKRAHLESGRGFDECRRASQGCENHLNKSSNWEVEEVLKKRPRKAGGT